jgi:hypothetical protein
MPMPSRSRGPKLKPHRTAVVLAALASLALSASASAQLPPLGPAGNGIFNLYINPAGGVGVGDYTITTGAQNLAGAGKNVLFGDGQPNTTYMEIGDSNAADNPSGGRTVYVEGGFVTQPDQVNLDNYPATVVPVGSTGFKTTWTIGQPDLTSITELVNVHGTTEANSSVEVTTTLQGAPSATFDVQYLWDYQLGTDDGPALQTESSAAQFRPFSPTATTEMTYSGGSVPAAYTVVDNDGNPSPPTFSIGATGASGPAFITPAPTAAREIQYACWPQAVLADLDSYTTTPGFDIATQASSCLGPDGNDSAVIYQLPTATLDFGGSATVSESLFMSPGTPDRTALTAQAVQYLIHQQDSYLSAKLTDTKYAHGIPGRTVVFTGPKGVLCSAVTDASGTATCLHGSAGQGPIIASYAGGAIWAPVQVKAKMITRLSP